MRTLRSLFLFLIITTSTYAADFPSLSPMLEKARPAIVNIQAQGNLPPLSNNNDDSPSKRPRKPRTFNSLGSGVVIDPAKGYIVSNAHVIRNASNITVTTFDGRRQQAKIIGTDPASDVAVIQIKPEKLHSITLGESTRLKVGDFVVAIGNPFGLNSYGNNQSATFGIVSALQRNSLNIEGVENFIQTDAAINPGNSGGALVNTKGELVGINTAILTPIGGNIGIGFAIPIDLVKDISQQLIKYGSVDRGLMGIFVQHLTPELAEAFKLPANSKGAIVTQVNKGSPADKAGLKPGDVIAEINKTPITDAAQVKTAIGLLRVGGKANIRVLRGSKSVLLSSSVSSIKDHEKTIQDMNPFLYGMALSDFKQQSPVHGLVEGVQIDGASENSAGWQAGVRPGDVIISVNGQKTHDLKTLHQVSNNEHKQLLVHVLRGPGALYFIIK